MLAAKDAETATVQYDDLFEGPSGTAPYKEELRSSLLRPKPPEPPADWWAALTPGCGLELQHELGWWQVKYVASQVGTDKVLVASINWGTQHLVDASALRPGWRWTALNGGEWSVIGVGGGSKNVGGGTAAAAGPSKRGRGGGRGTATMGRGGRGRS